MTPFEPIQPVELTAESIKNPLGIDILRPALSWKLISSVRGTKQTAYRILVAHNEESLSLESDLVWDSGKVLSGRSVHIEYGGEELVSRGTYVWKVKVWDQLGRESSWSGIAHWEMGLLQQADWIAKWIEPEQKPALPEEPINLFVMFSGKFNNDPEVTSRLQPCQLLRKTFRLKQAVRRARIYVTAHGVYRLELNGQRVGDRELAPEITSYNQYLQYQTYDVSDRVLSGDNALGVVLADGWYAGRVSLTGDSCQYGNRLGLLLQLEVEYADGSRETVCSDGSFRSNTGPWVYSDIFIGEKYDARLEQQGFSTSGFDDSIWLPVREMDYPLDNLTASYGEPVRAVQVLPAKEVHLTPKGETVIDFGQVIAGRVRMRVSGPAGTEITLVHSETLDRDGNFLFNINGRHKHQTDVYILRGAPEERFEPQFTFHGFRYMKVTGYPGEVKAEFFEAVVLSSDLKQTGQFLCSDPQINRLQENIFRSQRGNMLAIPTDCPQRERLGYTGDFQVFAPTAMLNMDMNAFVTRWLRNLRLEQREDGQVPNTVPWLPSDRERDEAGNVSSAGWGDAAVIVPWMLYQAYGDARILRESYASMVRWVKYAESAASSGVPADLADCEDTERLERQQYLWNTGFHFGDWLTPSLSMSLDGRRVDMMKSAFLTSELVATCFYAYSTELLSQAAAILGYEEDAKRYKDLNERIRRAFSEEYLGEDGRLKIHLQGVYVLALEHRMVPDSMRGKVLSQLASLIEENGHRLDTGFMSIPFLMNVLSDNGLPDLAYRLLYQKKCPSWLYEVEKGATTIWEAWNTIMPDGTVLPVSQNHYAFGCVGSWLYRHLAGINQAEPGYKSFRVAPHPESGLSWVKAAYESVYGTIGVEWRLVEGEMVMKVTVPVNTSAVIQLPGGSQKEVWESGVPLREVVGLTVLSAGGDGLTVEAGSGVYEFRYSYGK